MALLRNLVLLNEAAGMYIYFVFLTNIEIMKKNFFQFYNNCFLVYCHFADQAFDAEYIVNFY